MIVNIYVEHAIDEAELLKILPLIELEAGPSSYRGCDSDEDIFEEHRDALRGEHRE